MEWYFEVGGLFGLLRGSKGIKKKGKLFVPVRGHYACGKINK